MNAGTKQCRDCGEVKPVTEFTVAPRNRDGRYSYCKACNAAKARAWRERHPERHQATMARRYARLKAAGMCVICGAEPVDPGLTLCAVCGEKQRERATRRYRSMDTEQRRAYVDRQTVTSKERYARLKAEGICPHCRKRPATPGPRGGMTHCDECRAEKRRQREGRHHDRA